MYGDSHDQSGELGELGPHEGFQVVRVANGYTVASPGRGVFVAKAPLEVLLHVATLLGIDRARAEAALDNLGTKAHEELIEDEVQARVSRAIRDIFGSVDTGTDFPYPIDPPKDDQ